MTKPDAEKVLIYALNRGRLLVFDEPDFPEVELQVPGGTIESGENVADAALREFQEETGVRPDKPLVHIDTVDYRFRKGEREICHRRHFFAVQLDGNLPQSWVHFENHAFDGSPPIQFRFSWIDLGEAASKLGYGMELALGRLERPTFP